MYFLSMRAPLFFEILDVQFCCLKLTFLTNEYQYQLASKRFNVQSDYRFNINYFAGAVGSRKYLTYVGTQLPARGVCEKRLSSCLEL